jgi:2,3-bisphosphoglycerate-independent phosphoglycerate mutase
MKPKQKVLLIVLDGLGAAPKNKGNAVVLANPQNLSTLWNIYPHTYLLASGEAVGLPKNVRGNSEVGHLIWVLVIVVAQTLHELIMLYRKGLISNNETLQAAFIHANKTKVVFI